MKGLRNVGLSLLCEHLEEMSKSRKVHYVSNGNMNWVLYPARKSILRSNNFTPKLF